MCPRRRDCRTQTQAAEAEKWETRACCEAVRDMINAGDVQGAMEAVAAVDSSILQVFH